MLPNKMKISEKAFNSLRRLQSNTGLTINIGARIAFFTSIEKGHKYDHEEIDLKHRELDKHTWLGDQSKIVELLLAQKYPDFSKSDLYKAWASHIEDGSREIEGKLSLIELASINF